jgi:phage tail-like protein
MNTKLIVSIAVAAVAVLVGGLAYVVLGGSDDDSRRTAALSTRSYTTGNLALEIDGVNAGFLRSVAGCDVTIPVVSVAGTTQKESGAPKFTPCTIRFGGGMKATLYQWISDSLAGKPSRRNVSIVTTDVNYQATGRLNLLDTALESFTVPALQAGSTEQVVFEATLAAASIKRAAASGPVGSTLGTKSKQMLAGNFRVSGAGLENDLKKASGVTSWSFELPSAPVGEVKFATSGPPQLGDLGVTISGAGAEFDAWLDGALKGTPAQKALTVSLMDATFTQSLFDLNLTGVGLTGADLLGSAEGESTVKRTFTMYVSGASTKFNTGVVG